MRRLFLFALLLTASPAQAAVVFFSGLETANINEFPALSNSSACTAGTSTPHTGTYYFDATSNGGIAPQACEGVFSTSGSPTTIFARYWFRYTTGTYSSSDLIQRYNPTAGSTFQLFLSNSTNKAFFCYQAMAFPPAPCGSPIATGTTVLSADTWYQFEVKVVISATVGGMQVKINNNTEFSSFGTNTSGSTAISSVGFGQRYLNSNIAGYGAFDYDDMMVCTTADCPLGISIARQGLAGTPTYDAWTKTSCTTANECWSETPFSATKNANSATASAAQTMLVHDFGSTQTGRGTQVIAAHDTVNACKTAAVAKMATASSFSLRRRINGSDTDTATTLIATDAYYDDGIWTTTASILRTSTNEIGGVHGTGTNTMTVEDMWLLCDYLVVATGPRHRVTQ